MIYTAEELLENFNQFINKIETNIKGERGQQLIQLHTDHQERIMLMPASGNINYHNCFIGGYVDHVIRVIDCAIKTHEVWKDMGATINYTVEELVFAAICHDLGKIGTEQAEQYIHNPSDWHRKNQGKLYTNNPANCFMTVPDRSLKLLADRGIAVTENEWFGIKLHDGLYEEANRSYYINYNPDSSLRTNLPYVLHQADLMASRIEKNKSEIDTEDITNVSKPTHSKKTQATTTDKDIESLKNVFDSLFNND
jgi:hypothetical protein